MKTTDQHALTVITPIKPGREHQDQLKKLFEAIVHTDIQDEKDPPHAIVPFKLLTTIHFARWAILPGDGNAIPDSVMFSSNFDGPLDDHLKELARVAGPSGLDKIYAHCEGYPANPTDESRIAYLKAHRSSYGLTFYVGTKGRAVEQVNNEAILRDAIQCFVDDSRNDLANKTPAQIREAVRQFVFDEDQLKACVKDPKQFKKIKDWVQAPPASWVSPFRRFLKGLLAFIIQNGKLLALVLVVLFVLGVLTLLGILAGPAFLSWFAVVMLVLLTLALLWYILLRSHEKRDRQAGFDARAECDEDLIQIEDRVVQNQMTSITALKPGAFRRFTLRVVLWGINLLARYLYTDGQLGSIPTIHFARWVIIDKKKRLLFLSNFDGSWENYLGDFIDKAAVGLTAVWSNTQRRDRPGMDPSKPRGFPDTKNLVQEGARDEQRFKAYTRDSQVVTNVWYTARKKLSVENVNRNSKLRAGLYGEMSEKEIRDWLRLI